MKAAVIIPTKNPGPIFRSVLDAVLSQETEFDYEVLVIDSGSTDGTQELVGDYEDARLRLHRIAPETFGHGRTRNLGASMTEAEYCAFLTHDALPVDRHWLANLVSTAEAAPDIAGVFGRHVAYPDASPFTRHELEQHFAGFQGHPVVRLSDDAQRYAEDTGWRQYAHYFSDNNALIRRSVWSEIPYPDVDFAEDQIWAQKIVEAGWAKAYAHDAPVYHSHDYTLLERLQRSFDEAYAFRRLFGYRLCPTFAHGIRSAAALTRRDFGSARQDRLHLRAPVTVARVPFDNLMRVAGHFLGAHGERVPEWLRLRLSRDKRMLRGLPAPSARRRSRA